MGSFAHTTVAWADALRVKQSIGQPGHEWKTDFGKWKMRFWAYRRALTGVG
jgi:hypothetical protein